MNVTYVCPECGGGTRPPQHSERCSYTRATRPKRSKITVGKYNGNDAYSWAVFVDDRPAVTGLSRAEVPYHRKAITELVAKGARDDRS